jgi:predicted RNA-binding protein associated with RNAse of E/G family
MIERKIRYDGSIAEYRCQVLSRHSDRVVLTYVLPDPVILGRDAVIVNLPAGSRTYAWYWTDRPYNVYIWQGSGGNYLGAYFNIVRNTRISDQVVSYEDLIVDLLVTPEGKQCVLDRDELPESMEQFEQGYVNQTLKDLIVSAGHILAGLIQMKKSLPPGKQQNPPEA